MSTRETTSYYLFVQKRRVFNRRSSVLKAKDQKLLKNESRAHPGTRCFFRYLRHGSRFLPVPAQVTIAEQSCAQPCRSETVPTKPSSAELGPTQPSPFQSCPLQPSPAQPTRAQTGPIQFSRAQPTQPFPADPSPVQPRQALPTTAGTNLAKPT